MNGLMLHCGGQLATRDQVFAVQPPSPTNSYFPLSYESFVTRIEKQIAVEGIIVKEQQLALSKEGQRLFGLMQLQLPSFESSDYGCVLGLRNSYDKSCSAGLCIGATVFVCDNLSFRGSAITFQRKHTANLLKDMSWIITETIAKLPSQFEGQSKLFELYQNTELTDTQAHDLIIRFYDRKAINAIDIPGVLREWRTPRHEQFASRGKTAWRLFNAATEIMKGDLWRLPSRSAKIHEIVDAECDSRKELVFEA